MGKYDTWSITCKLCDWQWETCSGVMAKNPKCSECGSTNCLVEKNMFIPIKKQGKIISDMGFEQDENRTIKLQSDQDFLNCNNRPFCIIREHDCRFSDELSVEDKKNILDKIDHIKLQIIRDIIDNK